MFDQHIRTQAWLRDLDRILVELDQGAAPAPAPGAKRRTTKRRPLWEA